MQRRSLLLKPASLARLGLLVLLVGLSGCEGWTPVSKEATESDPSRFRRALVSEQARLARFVVSYVRRQETIRAGKRLDRQEVGRLLEEALRAYERAYGVEGVVMGYRRAQAVLERARSGDRLTVWWDSLGLDEEQQVWMGRLWEEFRTSHTVAELDERLVRYEREVVEALGAERSEVLLWHAAVLYDMAVLVFGREEWVEAFWALVEELMGEGGGRGGMAWRGGGGWLRLVQQNTTCELNSMPQIGDYRTWEGAVSAVLKGVGAGCASGAGIGAAVGSVEPGLGTAVGAAAGCLILAPIVGAINGAFWYFLDTRNMYKIDLARWCRQNYSVCKNNEYYQRACNEIIRPE